jgi:predicted NUDIX family NTP pyrophosphohydrolase
MRPTISAPRYKRLVAAKSSGLLAYRVRDGALEVFLVHPGGPFWARKDDGAWSIPKGEHSDDEDPQACARREFEEETGTALPADTELLDLGSVRLASRKEVAAWAVAADLDADAIVSNEFEIEWPPRSGRKQSFPEVDRAGWFSPDEARVKLNPAQAELVDRLVAARPVPPG